LSDAECFIWCDAGCVREDRSELALKQFGTRNHPLNDGKIHVQYTREQQYKPFYVYPEYRFAGAIIAGNRSAWLAYSDLYDKTLKEYDDAVISGNSDQYVMASCYDKNKDLFKLHSPMNNLIDSWFFFLGLL
jgi:hypothetical protein